MFVRLAAPHGARASAWRASAPFPRRALSSRRVLRSKSGKPWVIGSGSTKASGAGGGGGRVAVGGGGISGRALCAAASLPAHSRPRFDLQRVGQVPQGCCNTPYVGHRAPPSVGPGGFQLATSVPPRASRLASPWPRGAQRRCSAVLSVEARRSARPEQIVQVFAASFDPSGEGSVSHKQRLFGRTARLILRRVCNCHRAIFNDNPFWGIPE